MRVDVVMKMIFLFKTNRNQNMSDETKEYEPDELAPGSKAGPPLTKQCSICKQTKEASCFHKDSSKKDGLDMRCKECKSEDNKKRREKRNLQRVHDKKSGSSLILYHRIAVELCSSRF